MESEHLSLHCMGKCLKFPKVHPQYLSVIPILSLMKDITYFGCSGDVGGQRVLRPYWRNYFEQTDALVWVVDSGDRLRMQDCKEELHALLQEEVCPLSSACQSLSKLTLNQRLAGASLLVFANKQDIQGSLTDNDIREVRMFIYSGSMPNFEYRLSIYPLSKRIIGKSNRAAPSPVNIW